MENYTIYAKTLDRENFDYRVYEDYLDDSFIIDGGREWISLNEALLKSITMLYNDYGGYCYEVYYNISIKELVNDLLPPKDNGKKYSPRELSIIKKALETDKKELFILACLSIIKGQPYRIFGLRGCYQGDYVQLYAPASTPQKDIDWIEAWYFGTGIEIEIHDTDAPVESEDDVEGFTFYTASWRLEDIKRDIREYCGANPDTPVVLFQITGSHTVKVNHYERV